MSLRDFLFENDPKDPPRPLNVGARAVSAPTPTPFGFQPPSVSPIVTNITVNEEVYQRLKAKTDFDQTTAGQTLAQFMAPLATVLTDETQRFRAALATAGAQSGLTGDKILQVFDGLKITLQNEVEEFNRQARSQTEQDVSGGEKEIAALQAQIAQLQTTLAQKTNEVAAARTKIASASQQFTLAAQRRATELETQKAKFAGMLR